MSSFLTQSQKENQHLPLNTFRKSLGEVCVKKVLKEDPFNIFFLNYAEIWDSVDYIDIFSITDFHALHSKRGPARKFIMPDNYADLNFNRRKLYPYELVGGLDGKHAQKKYLEQIQISHEDVINTYGRSSIHLIKCLELFELIAKYCLRKGLVEAENYKSILLGSDDDSELSPQLFKSSRNHLLNDVVKIDTKVLKTSRVGKFFQRINRKSNEYDGREFFSSSQNEMPFVLYYLLLAASGKDVYVIVYNKLEFTLVERADVEFLVESVKKDKSMLVDEEIVLLPVNDVLVSSGFYVEETEYEEEGDELYEINEVQPGLEYFFGNKIMNND